MIVAKFFTSGSDLIVACLELPYDDKDRLDPPYDEDTILHAKHLEEQVEGLDDRLEKEELDTSRPRNPYFRDYGRIMYSSSFRRLQGKMQLLGVEHTNFYRNRLTHSLEVSQISRGIAERLKLHTTVVAEASSLAHDLGNPPFGHHGERVLNRLAADIGGYEGNAQTLRILMRLEKKHPDYRGLNLTLRTLLGVIKYPHLRGDGTARGGTKEKFIYGADHHDISEKLRSSALGVDARTIDMQVMDLADEIAYAAHDLEDCLSTVILRSKSLCTNFRGAMSSDQDTGHYKR
jgi:dGTPase